MGVPPPGAGPPYIQPRLYDIPGYLHACRIALQDNGLQKKMKPGILQFSRNQDATRD